MVDKITHDEHHEAGSEKKDDLAELETRVKVDDTTNVTKNELADVKEPTLEGIQKAYNDLLTTVNNSEPDIDIIRREVLTLRAYATLDGGVYKTQIRDWLHGLKINNVVPFETIIKKGFTSLDTFTSVEKYLVALHLLLSGYMDTSTFDEAFGYDPLLDRDGTAEHFAGLQTDALREPIKKYEQFSAVRDNYKDRYKDGYIYTDAENLALYENLLKFSPEERSGRLVCAERLPLIKKLHAQTSAPADLSVLLDDNPNNNTQELMFLDLYLLADSESVPVSITEESPKLLTEPGAGYEKKLLGHVKKFIDKNNRASETLSLEEQLTSVALTIDRLVVASDVADPEKKGENIDQYLVNAVEEKIDALAKPSYDKMKNLNVKDIVDVQTRVQKFIELYVEKFLFNHSVSHSQLLWALSCLPLEKKMDYLKKLSDRTLHLNVVDEVEEVIVEKDSPPSSMGLGYSRELGYGTYIDPEQLDSLLSQDNSMFTNVDQLLAAHKAFVLNLRANLSFTGNGVQHKIPILGFRPRWQMMPARSENEKNLGLLDVQKKRYEEVLGNVTQDTPLSKIDSLDAYFEEVAGGVITNEEDEKISNMLDPRTQMVEAINQKIASLLIEQYEQAPDAQKDELANKMLAFVDFICPKNNTENDVADYGTATQLTDFLLDERGLVELKNEDEPILSQEEEKKWQQTYFSEKGLDITQIENKSLGDLFVSRRDIQPKDASITETGLFDIKISSIPHEERPMVYALALALQNSPTGGDEEISRGLVDIIQEYMGAYGMHVYMYAREHAKIAYKKTGLRDIDKKIIKSHKNIWGISENGKDGGYKIGDNNPHMLMINLSLGSKISGWFLKFLTKSYRKKNRRKWGLGGAGGLAVNGLLRRYTDTNIFGILKVGGSVLWRLLKLIGEGVGIHIKDGKKEQERPKLGETERKNIINAIQLVAVRGEYNNKISITHDAGYLGWIFDDIDKKTKKYQMSGEVEIGFDLAGDLKTLIPTLNPDKNGNVIINLPAPFIKVFTCDLECLSTEGGGVGVKDANVKFEQQANGWGQYFAFIAARDKKQKPQNAKIKFLEADYEGNVKDPQQLNVEDGIDMVQLAKNTIENNIKALYKGKAKNVIVNFQPGIDKENSTRFKKVTFQESSYPVSTKEEEGIIAGEEEKKLKT